MSWNTPKTDWIAADFYSIEAWNRVYNNLVHLKGLLKQYHFGDAVIHPHYAAMHSELDMPYVQNVNGLEATLDNVYDAFGLPLSGWKGVITWASIKSTDWVRNPDYSDWNRWENIPQQIKQRLDCTHAYNNQRISGTCYAGGSRTTQRFSRGR